MTVAPAIPAPIRPPTWARIAAAVFNVALVVVALVLVLPSHPPVQGVIFVAVFSVLATAINYTNMRPAVFFEPDALVVRNKITTKRLPRYVIFRFEQRKGQDGWGSRLVVAVHTQGELPLRATGGASFVPADKQRLAARLEVLEAWRKAGQSMQ